MAIDNRLQVFNEEGQSVDYDILASDVKFLPDGKDLPTKLAEMEQEIEEAGSGDGTVTGVKVGSTTYEPTEGVVDISEPFANKVDKETNKVLIPSTDLAKLQNLPTADQLTQQMSTKANDNAVVKSVSVNGGTAQTPQNGNVNVVVPTLTLDDEPTAGSPNGVKSGGVKTALNAKANAADVPTKTEMADAIDDALGEAQVTVVPANSVGVIASLGSDSDEDALAASMGKKLKVAVLTILNSLGNYAFPGGKPTIDWGDSSTITYGVTYPDTTTTKVTHGNAPDTVNLGDMLEVTLGTNDDLYVINDDSVKVYMNNVEQIGAYDSATQKVTIAAVIGTVVIVANTMTYVGYGENNSPLVLMFDGKNQGETVGQWKDLANTSRSVALTGGYTQNSDNVQLDGTGYGMGSFVDNVTYNQSTAECVFKQATAIGSNDNGQAILIVGKTGAPILVQFYESGTVRWATHARMGTDTFTANRSVYAYSGSTGNKYSVSYYGNKMLQNGNLLTAVPNATTHEDWVNVANHGDKTAVGAQITGGGDILGFKGNLYCVRLYSRVLTDAEAQQNWKVDQKRFNIS